jgi:hypothetical protein
MLSLGLSPGIDWYERFTPIIRVKCAFDSREDCVIIIVRIMVVILDLRLVGWWTLVIEPITKIIIFHRILSLLDLVRDLKGRYFFVNVLLFRFRLTRWILGFVLWSFRSSPRPFFHEWWKVFILLLIQIYFIDMGRLQIDWNIVSVKKLVSKLLRVNVLNLNDILVVFLIRWILPCSSLITRARTFSSCGTCSRHNLVLLLLI